MGVLADWQIQAENIVTPFVRLSEADAKGKITWGVSHYGYDVRACEGEFQIFSPAHAAGGIIDPKNFDEEFLTNDRRKFKKDGAFVIPANSFALTQTIEHLEIPRGVLATVLGKSTYARCGIIVNVTPLEPEWRGRITIEISNTTPLPAKIYPGEGIAQVLFHRADGYTQVLIEELTGMLAELHKEAQVAAGTFGKPSAMTPVELAAKEMQARILAKLCTKSYADKKGRYQDQGEKVVLPCASGDVPREVTAEG
jgi:dCTP deaminase